MVVQKVLASLNSFRFYYYSVPLRICYSSLFIISCLIAVSFFSDISKSVVLQIRIYSLQAIRFCIQPVRNTNRHLEYQNSKVLELNDKILYTPFLSLESLLLPLCLLLLHFLSLEVFFSVFFTNLLILFSFTH